VKKSGPRNIRHSKAYEDLAIHAGLEAGLEKPDAKSVADDPGARAVRDETWMEYERRLRDRKTYTLEDIRIWLHERGVEVSIASVNRDGIALGAQERVMGLAAEKAKAFVEACGASGETDLLAASRRAAGQLIFQFFSSLSADALEALKPGQIISLMDVLGRLSTANEQTGILKAKLSDLQAKIDAAKAAADKKASALLESKSVDSKTIDMIRQLYGLPPLAEIAKVA
jgi:hypothetical protein